MKRSWTVIVGNKRFTLIVMDDSDPLAVVKSIWPEGTNHSAHVKSAVHIEPVTGDVTCHW